MKKNKLKYIIDAILFIDICTIAAIGLLLAFVIPKGKEAHASKFFLGLHRHEWGNIHLNLSILLLALLIFHLWMNWSWIIQSSKRYFGHRWQKILYVISGSWIIVLIVMWIFAKL